MQNQLLSHFDNNGNAVMVDVSEKEHTDRRAVAEGTIRVDRTVFEAISNKTLKKGDVLQVAQLAGIMGVKKTSELIPLCHPLVISNCTIHFEMDESNYAVKAFCTVKSVGQTGVEMEALTGVTVALLTIYDMCKALNKRMEICDIGLLEKEGGKSGHFIRD